MPISKESFKIEQSFLMNNNHRVIVIGGSVSSGKTSFIEEVRRFYDSLGYYNLNYTFDPYNKTEQNNLRKFKNDNVVLYADDFGLGDSRTDQIKKLSTIGVLQQSYEKQVHKIFITQQLQRSLPFDSRESDDFNLVDKNLVNFADLVLKIVRRYDADKYPYPEDIVLKIHKNRLSTYQNTGNETNFFKSLATSYFIKNRNTLRLNRNFIKYLQPDFANKEVFNFTELFGYYK